MKKHLLRMWLVALMAVVGLGAQAQTTTLVSLPTGEGATWTDEDAVWDTGGATPTIFNDKSAIRISGKNGSYAMTKTIAPTENAIINVKAVWRGRSNTGRAFSAGNGSYFRFGNIIVAQNDQDQKHGYGFSGLSAIGSVTTFKAGSYRTDISNCTWLLIEMEINTASNTVTSFTIKSEDGETTYATAENIVLSDPDYTTIAFGYRKSGSVSTENTEDLKSLTITQTEQVVETADYTVKFVCDGVEVKDASVRTGVVGQNIGLTDTDLQNFYSADGSKKYIYVSNDAEGMTVSEGAVVTVTFREAEKYAWTAKSSVGSYSISGETFEGDKASAKYPLYINVDGTLWTKAAISSVFAQSFDVTENNQEFTLDYTETEITNVVFYAEVEDIEGMGIIASGNAEARSSQRAAGYSTEDKTKMLTLGYGKYQMTARFYSPTSAGGKYNFFAGNRNIWEMETANANATDGNVEFVLAKDCEISLGKGGYTQAVDFVYIQQLDDPTNDELAEAQAADAAADKAARVFGIVGDLTGGWDADLVMTQGTGEGQEDIYTAVVEGFAAKELKGYDYKLRQDKTWEGSYQLPTEGNQTWTPEQTGIYTLTFTADVANNTLQIAAERTGNVTFTAQFINGDEWEEVYAWAWRGEKNYTGGTWPGQKIEGAEGLYTWSYEATEGEAGPEYIIFNGGEGKPQTADLAFEDGMKFEWVKPVLNTYTATFKTNVGWEEVYAYAWTTEGENTTEFLGAWPGTKLEASEGVYTVTIEAAAAPANIIFNNGGNGAQTEDLVFEDGKAYEYVEELTDLVENGTFDTPGVTAPWKSTGGFQNQTTATNQSGAFTVPFFENWNPSAKANKMYQTIENIPNGTYKLRIAAFVNTLANPNESQFVYANNDKVYLTAGEPTAYEVTTNVTDNKIEIGLEQTTATANWMGIDNVSLSYIGAKNQFVKEMALMNLEPKQSVKTKNALQNAYDAFVADESDANKDALKSAIAASKVSIHSYKVLESGVLPDNSLEGWTCTNGNTFHINTWSVEGNSDGSGMVTPFIENWVWKGENGDVVLGTGEIFYSLPGLDPGIYQFSALIRAYSEGGNEPTGASLFAGNREKEFATGKNFEFNGMKGIYDTYAMACEVGEEGLFRFGIKIAEDRNFNWMAFKSCKVAYVGAAIDEAAVNDLAATMPEGKMNADVKANAEAAIATAKANISLDTYEAASKAIAAAVSSVAAYAKLKGVLDELSGIVEKTNVYTAAAKETYDAAYNTALNGYDNGTISDADANAFNYGSRLTGLIPELLLSAYTSTVEGTPYINTWSVEGNSDGSEFRTPFFEYWTGDGNSLGANTITAELTGMEAGEYTVTAWVRVRLKNNVEEPCTGITMQVNEGDNVNVCDGTAFGRLYSEEFTATGVVGEDGVLKIKFDVAADNNISWLSFKNVMYVKKSVEPEANYYIVGNMNDWTPNESYKMTLNEAAEGTTEYMFTMDLTTTSQFKVVKVEGEAQTWIPDGMGNAYGENGEITADGNYTIYFRPNADGGDDWFYNVIYAVKNTSVGISRMEAEALKGNVYNLNGQKVTKVQKGLYIVNGKKTVKN